MIPRLLPDILLAGLLCVGIDAKAAASGSTVQFAYPGTYIDGWCTLELSADGGFLMKSMHCPYPDSMRSDDSIVVWAKGQARLDDDHLLLHFGKDWPEREVAHLDYLVMQCIGGPRFMHPDGLRDFALAVHSGDPYHLKLHRGFTGTTSPFVDDCDLAPLPSELRRVAEAVPIRVTVKAVERSECQGVGAEGNCEATLVLGDGEAQGLVPGMHLYFPQCPGMDYAMSVEAVRPGSARVEILWSPRPTDHAARFIGTEFTTRMPACLPAERERFEKQAAEAE